MSSKKSSDYQWATTKSGEVDKRYAHPVMTKKDGTRDMRTNSGSQLKK
ncbi:hypothetical protein PPL_07775 [Heterostelium album PN500]|uniref:Uncharacterized protein n=1 Tax=Heterostelium pallidum (strain ATCC 26659 / Pp 5 / PN500) TaxID=670386 RepID=D3BGX3_HETP5|nr:hypothetical protein PPL_07775 [Heterostelium album PN500]EFA79357.1 hypothetical protein PPL_07775 [Heterostelium album PN500]|eukprot:XP_020431478.1 hypothetical protein PPL_07775 [Heterostelium album PN500]